MLDQQDILQTIDMIARQNLDIRTITMGISLLDCVSDDAKTCSERVYHKIVTRAKDLVKTGEAIENEFGIPIVNKRIPSRRFPSSRRAAGITCCLQKRWTGPRRKWA